MALPWSKRKSKEPAEEVEDIPTPKKKAKKRRPNEMLSSVIKETVEGPAVDLMRSTEKFLLGDGNYAMVLMLDVNEIGGLSQKDKGNSDKGQIVELITGDHIKVVATEAMIEDDKFAIIPTDDTLDQMQEFGILRQAEYQLTIVALDEFVIEEVRPMTFQDARNIVEGKIDVADFVGNDAKLIEGYDSGAAASPAEPAIPSMDDDFSTDEVGYHNPDEDVDDEPAIPTEEDDVEIPEGYIEDEPDYNELADADPYEGIDEYEDDIDEDEIFEDEDYPEVVDEDAAVVTEIDPREVTEEEVKSTIARHFYNTELGLGVDTSSFDAFIGTTGTLATFPTEADHDDWLGQQIAQLSRQANAELVSMRQESNHRLRQEFIAMMSRHAEEVVKACDTKNVETPFGQATFFADEEQKKRELKVDEAVSAKRKEVLDAFEAETEEIGQAAKRSAMMAHRERHKPRIDREIADIHANYVMESQALRDAAEVKIQKSRREDAANRMDLGVSGVLNYVAEEHQQDMEREKLVYQEWLERINLFLDDHRKDDVARIEALQEKLAADNRVEQVTAELNAQMEAMRREHNETVERLTAQIAEMHSKTTAELAEREKVWQVAIDGERNNAEAATKRAADLSEQLTNLDEVVANKYETMYGNQIASLKDDKTRMLEEAERSSANSKVIITAMMVMMGIMAMVTLMLGFVFGSNWNDEPAPAQQPAVVQQVPVQQAPQSSSVTPTQEAPTE